MRTFPFTVDSAVGLPAIVTIQRGTQTIRFTTYETTLTMDGADYPPAPGATISNVSFPADGTPATLEVWLMGLSTSASALFAQSPINPGDASRGTLDGWPISIKIVDPGNLGAGGYDLIPGATIGSITEDSRGAIVIPVNGPLSKTKRQVIEHYSLTGREDLGDARCKVDLAPYTITTTGQAVSHYVIQLDSVSDGRALADDTWYVLGAVTLTSGPLAGFPKFPIRWWNPPVLQIALFLPIDFTDVPTGTTMTVHAGCDLTREMCFRRFNNIVNLRAETFVTPGNPLAALGWIGTG